MRIMDRVVVTYRRHDVLLRIVLAASSLVAFILAAGAGTQWN